MGVAVSAAQAGAPGGARRATGRVVAVAGVLQRVRADRGERARELHAPEARGGAVRGGVGVSARLPAPRRVFAGGVAGVGRGGVAVSFFLPFSRGPSPPYSTGV